MADYAGKWQRALSWSMTAPRQLALEAGMEITIVAGAILAVAQLGLLPLGTQGLLIAAIGYALMAALVLAGLSRHLPHRHFGPANTITLCRAALDVLLLAMVVEALLGTGGIADPAFRWGMIAAAVIALVLDGADGWAARRTDMTSDFGARFDIETDAVFLVTMSLAVVASGVAGPWVLASGFAYYIFRVVGRFQPWLMAPLFPSLRRKAVCVAQGALLVAALVPVLPGWAAWSSCALGLALLVYSFAVDIIWLARRLRPFRRH
jgi:phosphatidylglycerophosphate synthase